MPGHAVLNDAWGADATIKDPGTNGDIVVDRSPAYVPITTTAATSRTLVAPTSPGKRVTVHLEVDGGDLELICESTINASGHDRVTMGDAGDFSTFVSVCDGSGGFKWLLETNVGGTSGT